MDETLWQRQASFFVSVMSGEDETTFYLWFPEHWDWVKRGWMPVVTLTSNKVVPTVVFRAFSKVLVFLTKGARVSKGYSN